MGKLVFEAETFEESVGGPLGEGATAPLDKAIGFHVNADHQVAYKPYVVRVTSINGDEYTFRFVNSESGNLVSGNEHTVNVADLNIAYRHTPSTLPTSTQFSSGKVISFLFLRRAALTGQMATDADASQVSAPTKWPKTAGDAT